MSTATKPSHIGRKISKIRELRGIKQEALAMAIGISQQTISNIENSETIDEATLVKVAQALEVTVEGIKNFTEEAMINYFNTFGDNASGQNFGPYATITQTFNPLDKLIEAYEENKKLYERLLQAEKDKVAFLEQLKK